MAKAEVLNDIISRYRVGTVLELGCGDGNQLSLANYPTYIGVDISSEAVKACKLRFSRDETKRFILADTEEIPVCEAGLSLDVIYHLVEDNVYENYMRELVAHSSEYIVLYTSDSDVFCPRRDEPQHIRHRPVGQWMRSYTEWKLLEQITNPCPYDPRREDETSFCDFYVYGRA